MNEEAARQPDDNESDTPPQAKSERKSVGDHVIILKTTASRFWYAQWNQDGQQYRRSLRTSSQKQAEKLAKEQEAKLTLGQAEDPRKSTVLILAAIDQYIESLRLRHRTPGTLRLYRIDLMQFARFAESQGVRRLDRLTVDLLEQFQSVLEKEGPAKNPETKQGQGNRRCPNAAYTIRTKAVTVRQLVNWAVRRKLLKEDPTTGFQIPPRLNIEMRPFTPEELWVAVHKSPAPYSDIFNFFMMTGLRNEEFCSLMKDDADFQRRLLHVRPKVYPKSGTGWAPKHGRSRVVPLVPEAMEIAKRAHDASPGPWLFFAEDTSTADQGKYQTKRIWRHLQDVLRENKMRGNRVHAFRHSFCSWMANKGVSPFVVMKILGHGSLAIVLKYYHLSDDEMVAALSGVSFSEMLRRPTERGKEVEPGTQGGQTAA